MTRMVKNRTVYISIVFTSQACLYSLLLMLFSNPAAILVVSVFKVNVCLFHGVYPWHMDC